MHLLIVEDEEPFAKILKQRLESEGFAVDWLSDSEKAFTRIRLYKDDYSLVLLDLTLHGKDSRELTESLRAEGVTTPIIILTGKSGVNDKIELLNSGADDYVVKPFAFEELLARVYSVLRRPKVMQPPQYHIGDIDVDTATHRMRIGQEEIPLTLKEYSLLECFLRRPNTVLTREEISSQLWDFDSVSWSNVLDVHMKNLRKKLSSKEAGVQLETIRGVGYRLVS